MWEGETPYKRDTYRYTPLLAWMLVPNILVAEAWGKCVFVLCDLLVGKLLELLSQQIVGRQRFVQYGGFMYIVALWLLNPVVINVSTRGNAESVISLMFVSCLYFLYSDWLVFAGIMFGLSVHFKVYPIIYSLALYLFVSERYRTDRGLAPPCHPHSTDKFRQLVLYLLNPRSILFSVVSALCFLFFTLLMYYIYGWEFLDQTYFYHIYRADHRHNFSVYFYYLYLASSELASSVPFLAIFMFIPQVVLLLIISLKYFDYSRLPFGLTLLTLTFVAFNKVCTVQYFVWYFCLFPLVVPYLAVSCRTYLPLALAWLGSQAIWLFFAYLLEFQGLNTFIFIWLAGLLFFFSNILIMCRFVKDFSPTPLPLKQD